MNARDAEALLTQLLEERGTDWVREEGYIRFRIRRGGMLWEADCLYAERCLVIYGRYPFVVADPDAALRLCNRANERMTRGAMLLGGDGRPVVRTAAAMDDIYDAEHRLREALEENIGCVGRHWGAMERLSAASGA